MYKDISKYVQDRSVTLVAVSKTKPVSEIQPLYDQGQRIFGENRVQEVVEKYDDLPKDVEWHLIGHLQKNKVKYIAPFIAMIHSVDGIDLLKTIQKESLKNNRTIPVLLQFYIAEEDTKFGLDIQEANEIIDNYIEGQFSNVKIVGVMGMASFTDNIDQVRQEFKSLKVIFEELKKRYFNTDDSFKTISMGMSGDYKIAIEEGSNMVRIGSAIFGSRN